MQGEKIGEESGKVTSQRILPNPDGGPKMETSFQASSTLLGTKATNRGTYWSIIRPSGTLYGEGQGIVMGEKGDLATWIGQGVGTMKKDGGVSYRGAVYYQTSSALPRSSSTRWTPRGTVARSPGNGSRACLTM